MISIVVEYPREDAPFEVSGICVTTQTRLFLLKHLLFRWRGYFFFHLFIRPLVIVVNGPIKDQDKILNFLSQTYLPQRLITLLYLIPPNSPDIDQFPVNKLRNLAIRNIVGSHLQILDMDLWTTVATYDTLKRLPSSLLKSNRTAVILPVFFFDRKRFLNRCDSVRTCSSMSLRIFPLM